MTKARNISNLSAINRWSKVLTTTSTTISGTDNFSATLSYVAGFEQVYFNGVFLTRGTDYTATNGTTVTLTNAPAVGDQVEVLSALPFTPDNTYTQAQANAAFYQTATTTIAGKNAIINGDFGIWQRGTTFTNPSTTAYTADRWRVQHDGTGATRTISQQTFTPGAAPVVGYEGKFFARYAVSVVGTGNTFQNFEYNQEDIRTFAGQTVTWSFWAKADASRTVALLYRRDFGTGGSAPDQYSAGTITLTTSWARYSVTYAVPSVSGLTIGANSYGSWIFRPTAATVQTIDLWGVQIEEGSVATAFTTASGSIAGELELCQRYYQKSYPIDIVPGSFFLGGYSLAIIQGNVPDGVYYNYQRLITRMRIAPTVVVYSGSGAVNRMSTVSASDLAASSALTNSISDVGFGITNNSGTTLTFTSGGYLFYYTASAEF